MSVGTLAHTVLRFRIVLKMLDRLRFIPTHEKPPDDEEQLTDGDVTSALSSLCRS